MLDPYSLTSPRGLGRSWYSGSGVLDVGAERDGSGTAAIVRVPAEAYAFNRLRGLFVDLGYPFFPLRRLSTVCDALFRHRHNDVPARFSWRETSAV